jgi:signal transduction histidine kinase
MQDNLPAVWADQLAIYHMVANLLENAIKFSPSEGVVRISTEAKDARVFLHVQDSGPGMSEEEQKKLFKSSWQGELGKTAPSGTGLGLYLCQQIVKAHRGEITCRSVLGQGTTFTVELPEAPLTVQEETVHTDSKESEVVLGL